MGLVEDGFRRYHFYGRLIFRTFFDDPDSKAVFLFRGFCQDLAAFLSSSFRSTFLFGVDNFSSSLSFIKPPFQEEWIISFLSSGLDFPAASTIALI